MNILPGIALYNQARQRDEDFIESFVARRELLKLLINILRGTARGGEGEPQIIVGQRGMGKSSLLRRVALGIKHDEELSGRFMPLQFREEQYNVNSLDVFWRNCGESLAQWCEDNDRGETARRLDAAIESAEWRDSAAAAEAFLGACKEIGKRPVLLVDNIDLVVDALKTKEQWMLRRVLQSPKGPILLGAATHFLTQAGERDAPFYEFFHPHVLEPLSEAELMHCMRSLADRRGPAGDPVREILAREPERLRTLYDLTGGNPRVLALIYQLLERRETGDVFADLEALLDQVSPYYKARVEEYATAQQRAAIDAIALNWDPISSHDLAARSGIEITTTSSHLGRMKKDGFVEEVPTSGARSGYQLAERFLNIWYLMRHGTRRARQRLQWLAKFLSRLYGAEQLRRMALDARNETISRAWHPDYREAVIAAFEETRSMFSHADRIIGNEWKIANQTTTNGRPGSEGEQPKQDSLDVSAIAVLGSRAVELFKQGDLISAINILDEFVYRCNALPQSVGHKLIAGALGAKALALEKLDRREESITAFNEVVARFGDSFELAIQELVAMALGGKERELSKSGRYDAAVATCDDIVARFGDSPEPKLQKLVARALLGKASYLWELGVREHSITALDEIVRRFGASPNAALQKDVSFALLFKGNRLGELGRPEASIAAYDDLASRFGGSSEPARCRQVAIALVAKALALGLLGRNEEAVAASDAVVSRYGGASEPALRAWVAWALVFKGICFYVLGRYEDAVVACDNAVVQFGLSLEPELRERVATALEFKGLTLTRLGRWEEAVAAYDDLMTRFGGSPASELRELLARASVNRALNLQKLGRAEEALEIYDVVAAKFGPSDVSSLQSASHRASCLKGNLLFDGFGDFKGAELAYRKALTADPSSEMAKANLAWLLLLTTSALEEARALRAKLDELTPVGLALLDAGLELASDNFGSAVDHLGKALDAGLSQTASDFFDDLLRLLRLAEARGYGERLVTWFESSGNVDKYAPVHVAFVAHLRGERFLLDVSPEVRRPARDIYDKLTAPRRNAHRDEAATKPTPRRRGRRKSLV